MSGKAPTRRLPPNNHDFNPFSTSPPSNRLVAFAALLPCWRPVKTVKKPLHAAAGILLASLAAAATAAGGTRLPEGSMLEGAEGDAPERPVLRLQPQLRYQLPAGHVPGARGWELCLKR